MKEERMLILSMLQEGKITAEEAGALLEALAGHDDGHEAPGTDRMAELKEKLERARDKVEEKLAEARHRIEAARAKADQGGEHAIEGVEDLFVTVERGMSRALSELPEIVGRFVKFELGFGGPVHQVIDTFEGEFAPDIVPEAAVFTRDGSVRWEVGDGPGYKVIVTNRVRAEDEDAARELASQATRWETDDGGFRLVVGDLREVSASVRVVLPRGREYRIEGQTGDGSVRMHDLLCQSVRLNTADGSIRVDDVQADQMNVASAVGSIQVSGTIRKLTATTADGSIRARFHRPVDATGSAAADQSDHAADYAADWDLHTSDGNIRIVVPTGDDVGYRLDLHTADGRLRADVPGAVPTEEGMGRHSITVETPDILDKLFQMRVTARTADGSVTVTTDAKGEAQ